MLTPVTEQSQELKHFILALSDLAGIARHSYAKRLLAIGQAEQAWKRVENTNEEGASEAYQRFLGLVADYNRDVASVNAAMGNAEAMSDHLLGINS